MLLRFLVLNFCSATCTAFAPLCSEGDEQNLFWFCRLLTWPNTKAQTCRSIRAAGAAHPFVMKLQIFGFVLLAHCSVRV